LEQRNKAGAILAVDALMGLAHYISESQSVARTHTMSTTGGKRHVALVGRRAADIRRMLRSSRIGVVERLGPAPERALSSLNLGNTAERLSRTEIPTSSGTPTARQGHRLHPSLWRWWARAALHLHQSVDKLLGRERRSFLDALVAFAEGDPILMGRRSSSAIDGRRVTVVFSPSVSSRPRTTAIAMACLVSTLPERMHARTAPCGPGQSSLMPRRRHPWANSPPRLPMR